MTPASTWDSPLTWINFGVLGLVVLGLLTGWVWAKPAVDRLVAERDRLLQERDHALAQRDAMAEVLQQKLLPVVGDFIVTTKALLPVLQELPRARRTRPVVEREEGR